MGVIYSNKPPVLRYRQKNDENEKRFTNTGNILHDALAKSKTIKVETIEDAEILCGVLNDLNYKAELFDKVMDITMDCFFNSNNDEVETLSNTIIKENEQLIQQRKDCIDRSKWFNNELKSLSDENKQLKLEIQQLKSVSTK